MTDSVDKVREVGIGVIALRSLLQMSVSALPTTLSAKRESLEAACQKYCDDIHRVYDSLLAELRKDRTNKCLLSMRDDMTQLVYLAGSDPNGETGLPHVVYNHAWVLH